jgi:hypothetical protein
MTMYVKTLLPVTLAGAEFDALQDIWIVNSRTCKWKKAMRQPHGKMDQSKVIQGWAHCARAGLQLESRHQLQ